MWPRWVERPAPAPLLPGRLNPAVRRLLQRIDEAAAASTAQRHLDAALDPEIRRVLMQAGLAALTLPVDAGGLGAGTRVFCLCMRHLARLGPAWPIMAVPHLCITVKVVEHLAPPAWRQRVFDGVVQRHELLVFAISEDRGSDLTAMQTRLSLGTDGRLRLQGAKQWITNLGEARHAVIAARHGEGMTPGHSLILLDLQSPGVRTDVHAWPKRCANGSATGALYLDDVVIGDDQVLGRAGDGLSLFQSMVQAGRLGATAALIGMAEACADACGRPELGDRLLPARLALEHAADCLDAADDPTAPDADLAGLCALVKHHGSVQAQKLLEELAAWCRHRQQGLPPLLLQCQHAAGMFRLLKGPGEVIGLQSLAGWLGRQLPPLAPTRWPGRRWAWAAETVRRSLARLADEGGPVSSPHRAADTLHLLASLHQCLSSPAQVPDGPPWQQAMRCARQLRHDARAPGMPEGHLP